MILLLYWFQIGSVMELSGAQRFDDGGITMVEEVALLRV
jgi:hypothetical protein